MDLKSRIFERFKVLQFEADPLDKNGYTRWLYVKITEDLYAAKAKYFRRTTPYLIFTKDFVKEIKDDHLVTKEFVNIDVMRTKKGTAWRVVPGFKTLLVAYSFYESRGGRWAPDIVWFEPMVPKEWVIFDLYNTSHGGGIGSGILLLKVPTEILGSHTPLVKVKINVTDKETEKFIVFADNSIAPEEVVDLGVEEESD